MKKIGIIGYPLSHTLSPYIHNEWLKDNDLLDDFSTYQVFEIEEDKFEDEIQNIFKRSDIIGFNVTLPYKEKIIQYCDFVSEDAKKIGAVNTIKIKNGKIFGYNTDAYGFTKKIEKIKKKNKAIVVGAGGASRSVIFALKKIGFDKIIVINRTYLKAKKIADEFNVFYEKIDYLEKSIINSDILINSSTMGLNNKNSLNINFDNVNKNIIVYDIVYKPLETKLLANAKKCNLKTINGLGMLIYQAEKSFEIWFNNKPKINNEFEEKIKKYL